MESFATNPGEKFASTALEIFFEQAVAPMITNDDYEGEIKSGNGSTRLNILTLDEDQGLQTYSGSNLTLGNATESEGQLICDQKKAWYFSIKSLDKFESFVNDPASSIMQRKAGELQEAVDAYVLGLYGDVGAGNRVGTDYTTGTVAVAVTTGVVTGTGTTFTSDMVGKGFKATGHSVWYRVKSFASTTSITIEDDKDDETSAYTGGAISAGASYTIEAATAVALTTANVYGKVVALRTKLNQAKVPQANRWLVVNADVEAVLLQSDEFTRATESDTESIRNGFIGKVAGFEVYNNEQIAGDNTTGYHVLAGHKSAITMAMAFTESGVEDLIGNFGKAYKGLTVYGAKVVDERRTALAELFCTV